MADLSRFNEEARRTLDLALREALASGHNYIGPEHLLLALIRHNAPLFDEHFDLREALRMSAIRMLRTTDDD